MQLLGVHISSIHNIIIIPARLVLVYKILHSWNFIKKPQKTRIYLEEALSICIVVMHQRLLDR